MAVISYLWRELILMKQDFLGGGHAFAWCCAAQRLGWYDWILDACHFLGDTNHLAGIAKFVVVPDI